MKYTPKIVRARIEPKARTVEEIRQQHKGQGLTYRDFENIKRANDFFTGLELYLSLWDYDKQASFHLHGWEPEADERMMNGMYYAEQTHPMPRYKGLRAEFEADWMAGTYDPGAIFAFDKRDVVVLEVIQEEEKEVQDGGKVTEEKAGEKKPSGSATGRKKKKNRRRGRK